MIYLDHHGTTPLSSAAKDAIRGALERELANPSSIHRAGRATRGLIEAARSRIASQCGAMARELVFTSGGTEALHLAVHSTATTTPVRAFFVDPGAHPALEAACRSAAKLLGTTAQTLAPTALGAVDVEALAPALADAPQPALVAVSWVQHELGAIANIRSIIDAAQKHGAVVVLDAVQALGKIPVDLGATGAVAAAISAHKVGGPTGVGAAWLRHDRRAAPLTEGGAQERGLRAGTENTLGIIGFGAAAEEIPQRLAAMPELARRRDAFEARVLAIDGVRSTAAPIVRTATAAHFIVSEIAGEELVAALDLDGLCVSSGPACSSGRAGVSKALVAMFPALERLLQGALRVTLAPSTTEAMLGDAATVIERVIPRVRAAR